MVKESEIRVLKNDEEVRTKHTYAQEHHKDTMNSLDIVREGAAVRRTITWNATQRLHQIQLDTDAHEAKIHKALSPRVQEVLRPFTARSYYQYKFGLGSYDPQPISLNRLSQLGALSKNVQALAVLNQIAVDPQDRVRPRWPFNLYWVKLQDDEKAYVREAQDYLLELGEVLIELGCLAP